MHGQKRNNSSWRFWLIGVALAMVVFALILLCARCAKQTADKPEETVSAIPVTYEVSAQDASGKDVSGKLLITPSTFAPEGADAASSVLVDISWVGNRSPEYPMIITIKDPSFVDNGGLIVFHYEGSQWEEVGTYLIVNNSVSFMVDSLSPFAFVPYEAYNTQPEATATPEPTATPSPTPEATATPSPTPSPSPSPSPSPTPSSGGYWVPATTPTPTPNIEEDQDETERPPVDDETTGGESTGGESTGGESTGGESTGGESTGGESTGGESTGGESTGGESTTGSSTNTGGEERPDSSTDT